MKFIDNKGQEHESYLTMLRIDITDTIRDTKEKITGKIKEVTKDFSRKEPRTENPPPVIIREYTINDSPVSEYHPQGSDVDNNVIITDPVVISPAEEVDKNDSSDEQPEQDTHPPNNDKCFEDDIVETLVAVDIIKQSGSDIIRAFSKINIDYEHGTIELYDINGNIVETDNISETIMQRVNHPEAYTIPDTEDPEMKKSIETFDSANRGTLDIIISNGANVTKGWFI